MASVMAKRESILSLCGKYLAVGERVIVILSTLWEILKYANSLRSQKFKTPVDGDPYL